MEKRSYKNCVVPKCTTTTKNSPQKRFFTCPQTARRRKQWFLAMNIKDYSPNSSLYVCEDHFDLPNDMENYTKFVYGKDLYTYHKLKSDAVPHLFDCQKDPKYVKKTPPRITSINRARKSIVEDILAASEANSTQISEPMLVQDILAPKEENTAQNIESIVIEEMLIPKEERVEQNITPTAPAVHFVSVSEDIESHPVAEDCSQNESSDFKTIVLHRDEPKPGIIREYLGFKKFTRDIGVQCDIRLTRPKIRSKRVQTSNKYFAKDVALSPIRFKDPPKSKAKDYISEDSYDMSYDSESSTPSKKDTDTTYDPENEDTWCD